MAKDASVEPESTYGPSFRLYNILVISAPLFSATQFTTIELLPGRSLVIIGVDGTALGATEDEALDDSERAPWVETARNTTPYSVPFARPAITIDELVDDTVERVLALAGIDQAAPKAWQGLR
jgi:hypothetical protein